MSGTDLQLTLEFVRDLPWGWILVAAVNSPILVLFIWILFGNADEFFDAFMRSLPNNHHDFEFSFMDLFTRGHRDFSPWAAFQTVLLLATFGCTVQLEYVYVIPYFSPSLAQYLASL